MAQEPNQKAIIQEAHQDERNGPQVLEEPEVAKKHNVNHNQQLKRAAKNAASK